MIHPKDYIESLFSKYNVPVDAKRKELFDHFVTEGDNINAVVKIQEIQKMLTDKWKLRNRITDIQQQPVFIPNATAGKPYRAKLDFTQLGWKDISLSEMEGLENLGLTYNNEEEIISGTPVQSGDLKLTFKFRLRDESENAELNRKIISLIINPDPKSLWQNKESDKDDPFWKADDITKSEKLGEKSLVVSSKRGRSHANIGSFRDDDFATKYFENGWSVVAVADGAGSAKLARKGSELACKSVVSFFDGKLTEETVTEFDQIIYAFKNDANEGASKALSVHVYNLMANAAKFAHQQLVDFSFKRGDNLKDYHTTLIFVLFKKYEFGYAILSFGVGDCPIALLNKDCTEVTLMNWLDVGEFGGGTRFITMPEIFTSDKFSTRFKFKLVDDFSFLFLMTDGIYDPKFVVEANLEKIEKWKEFLADLAGNNEDKIKVDFNASNHDIEAQLSNWLDFWSQGNHDDRTLAVIF